MDIYKSVLDITNYTVQTNASLTHFSGSIKIAKKILATLSVIKRSEEGKRRIQGEMDGPDIASLCRTDRWPRQNQCIQS